MISSFSDCHLIFIMIGVFFIIMFSIVFLRSFDNYLIVVLRNLCNMDHGMIMVWDYIPISLETPVTVGPHPPFSWH